MLLTAQNYSKGFLIDDEFMAGISENPDQPGTYVSFVLNHLTGQYEHHQVFTDLAQALLSLNQVPRSWSFESTSGCTTGCTQGLCGKGASEAPCGGAQPCLETGVCETKGEICKI